LKQLYPKVTSGDFNDPLVQYYTVLNSVINNQNLDEEVVAGYGPQHVDRVSHSVEAYRDKHGNSEWITEYQTIRTIPSSESLKDHIRTELTDTVFACRPSSVPNDRNTTACCAPTTTGCELYLLTKHAAADHYKAP